ncbi:hypothetical protein KORDIASMS9_04612 [Kordia sp. SMS9]|uniref:hypothetical protein n=1 Tax=Kordia sp. SMS9 TaxID=2282170 RepID=UPI000E0D4860|nr:hypothetical protein [Kordia sp. SMS9]AXG72341.1 hypothetical protein KORDIASMS9_04612 [Kordia sp. SMS9]
MKNYIKILVPTIILSTSIAFAQDTVKASEIVRENVTEYEIVEKAIASETRIYEETIATYPVAFDSEDKYDLNQERLIVSPILETTFKLDTNKDSNFEREITINYTKPDNFRYDFMLTRNGLNVWCTEKGMSVKEIHMIDAYNNKKKVNKLTKKGMYNIIMSNNDVYEIEVIDMK